MTPREREKLTKLTLEAKYRWSLHARRNQIPPEGDWFVWLLRSGRGFGKTRTGAEWVRREIESGRRGRIALVGQTKADVRDTMVEVGDSGLLHICPPWNKPAYEPSKRRLTWPNGAIAIIYSGDEPDQLRGPQHAGAWIDELAKFKYPQETWDNLELGLRLGENPQAVITTTPRPISIIKKLLADPSTRDTRASTFDNAANLSPRFLERMRKQYEGTRLGRQELMGELLEDVEGALWQRSWIDAARVGAIPMDEKGRALLKRVVVAVDPAGSHGEDADETGLAVAGLGLNGHYYVLHLQGYRLSPRGWAERAIGLYDEYSADRIIGEGNNGGEMVEHTIRTVRANAPFRLIHASRGKTVRAEPVAALYEKGVVHHVGMFPEGEDQMCAFPVASEHDDMVDAVVYAVTELIEGAVPVQSRAVNPFYG